MTGEQACSTLDGNAAGGLLREVFAFDATEAQTTCSGCARTVSNGSEGLTRIGVEELTTLQVVRSQRQGWRRAAQRSAGGLGAGARRWWVTIGSRSTRLATCSP